MEKQQPRTYGLAVLTQKDEDSGAFVAHCLNYDLMECGNTPEIAWQNIKIVIKAQVEHCYTYDKAGLQRVAKQEEWDKFYEAVQKYPNSVKVEQIQIELKPPLPEHEIPIWIQKVNRSGESPCI